MQYQTLLSRFPNLPRAFMPVFLNYWQVAIKFIYVACRPMMRAVLFCRRIKNQTHRCATQRSIIVILSLGSKKIY